jgi:hypothetical protein
MSASIKMPPSTGSDTLGATPNPPPGAPPKLLLRGVLRLENGLKSAVMLLLAAPASLPGQSARPGRLSMVGMCVVAPTLTGMSAGDSKKMLEAPRSSDGGSDEKEARQRCDDGPAKNLLGYAGESE